MCAPAILKKAAKQTTAADETSASQQLTIQHMWVLNGLHIKPGCAIKHQDVQAHSKLHALRPCTQSCQLSCRAVAVQSPPPLSRRAATTPTPQSAHSQLLQTL